VLEKMNTKLGQRLLMLDRTDEAIEPFRRSHELNAENPMHAFQEALDGSIERQLEIAQYCFEGTRIIDPYLPMAVRFAQNIVETQAHSAENMAAHFLLGQIYDQGGHGVVRSRRTAINWYKKGILLQSGKCRIALADALITSRARGVASQATREYVSAFNEADPALTLEERVGAGVKGGKLLLRDRQSPAKKKEGYTILYRIARMARAPAINRSEAAAYLGRILINRFERSQEHYFSQNDLSAAFTLFTIAKDLGFEDVARDYGLTCLEIARRQRNRRLISVNYQRAIEGGHRLAAYELGLIYLEGRRGIRRNFSRAVRYLGQALDLGFPAWDSAMEIGVIYLEGRLGVQKNHDLARKYLQMAVDHGVQGASERIEETKEGCVLM
nr:hypothetical protein [Chlamydiota bacterium]